MTTLTALPSPISATLFSAPGMQSESYWWLTGGDFNRPVMACMGVGVRLGEGGYVWLRVWGGYHGNSYEQSDLENVFGAFQLHGPVEFPKHLWNWKNPNHKKERQAEPGA